MSISSSNSPIKTKYLIYFYCFLTKSNTVDIMPLLQLHLQTQLGSLPVSPFSVVSDLVAGFESKPLGQRSVLLLGFSQHLFDLERFVGSHFLVGCCFDSFLGRSKSVSST